MDWMAFPGAAGYILRTWYPGHYANELETAATQHTFRNLAPGLSYRIALHAVNKSGIILGSRDITLPFDGNAISIDPGPEPLTFLRVSPHYGGSGNDRHLHLEWDGPNQTGHYEITYHKTAWHYGDRLVRYITRNNVTLFNLPRLPFYNITITWKPGPGSKWPSKSIRRRFDIFPTPTPAPAATNTPAPNFPNALTSITVSNITDTSAVIDWDGPTLDRNRYIYQVDIYGEQGRSIGSHYSWGRFRGLRPGTSYSGHVRLMQNAFLSWRDYRGVTVKTSAQFSFTTTGDTPTPTYTPTPTVTPKPTSTVDPAILTATAVLAPYATQLAQAAYGFRISKITQNSISIAWGANRPRRNRHYAELSHNGRNVQTFISSAIHRSAGGPQPHIQRLGAKQRIRTFCRCLGG